jgi:hypothetical protein
MTRRDATWLIARATGAAGATQFFSNWMRAAQSESSSHGLHSSHPNAPPDPHDWSSYKPQFFSPDEFRVLEQFTFVLIPTDETPGAREAHVAAYIDFVVNAASEYAPETQTHWREAVHWIAAQSFDKLSADAQINLVSEMSEPERDPSKQHLGYSYYRLVKDMTVRAFYTSRIGLIDVLEYKGLAYLTEFPACTHPEHHEV